MSPEFAILASSDRMAPGGNLRALFAFLEAVMRIIGTILPFIGRAIAPCNGEGHIAWTDEEAADAHHETGVFMVAWLGYVFAVPFGDMQPRTVDPDNPRQYAPGNL